MFHGPSRVSESCFGWQYSQKLPEACEKWFWLFSGWCCISLKCKAQCSVILAHSRWAAKLKLAALSALCQSNSNNLISGPISAKAALFLTGGAGGLSLEKRTLGVSLSLCTPCQVGLGSAPREQRTGQRESASDCARGCPGMFWSPHPGWLTVALEVLASLSESVLPSAVQAVLLSNVKFCGEVNARTSSGKWFCWGCRGCSSCSGLKAHSHVQTA